MHEISIRTPWCFLSEFKCKSAKKYAPAWYNNTRIMMISGYRIKLIFTKLNLKNNNAIKFL